MQVPILDDNGKGLVGIKKGQAGHAMGLFESFRNMNGRISNTIITPIILTTAFIDYTKLGSLFRMIVHVSMMMSRSYRWNAEGLPMS